MTCGETCIAAPLGEGSHRSQGKDVEHTYDRRLGGSLEDLKKERFVELMKMRRMGRGGFEKNTPYLSTVGSLNMVGRVQ